MVGEEGSLNSREKEAKSREVEGRKEAPNTKRPTDRLTDSQEFARKKKVPLLSRFSSLLLVKLR